MHYLYIDLHYVDVLNWYYYSMHSPQPLTLNTYSTFVINSKVMVEKVLMIYMHWCYPLNRDKNIYEECFIVKK